jgi:hypothetical protein
MNLNSNVRLLITTSPDADSTPQLWLKQSICLLKIQDNETNNEGWWPHLHRRLWHRIWRVHLAVLAIPHFLHSVCFYSSIPLIVFTAATDFKHTQFHGRCSELNCTSGSFLETTWRGSTIGYTSLARQSSLAGSLAPTDQTLTISPSHLLILLHLLWCRPRRLTTLRRLIKMLNLWDFIDPTTKNSCICVK